MEWPFPPAEPLATTGSLPGLGIRGRRGDGRGYGGLFGGGSRGVRGFVSIATGE